MSPSWGVGVFQAGIAVVERDPAIEGLIKLDFCSREAEVPILRGNLEAVPLPLHDVVVADDAFVKERADTLKFFGSRAPSFGGLAWNACEAAVVIGDELAQGQLPKDLNGNLKQIEKLAKRLRSELAP